MTPNSSPSRLEELLRATCTPSREAAAVEERARLTAAIQALPERYREAIDLYYFQGRSLGEVAECTGLLPSGAQSRVARAVARLTGVLRRNEASS